MDTTDNNHDDISPVVDNDNYVIDDNDLFDYFDPLLDPHMYPKGIGSSTKPKVVVSSQQQQQDTVTTNTRIEKKSH